MNMAVRHSSEEMAEILRRRICFSTETQNEKLHEGALAQEFGVSRTPVRQVLQRLAYEKLIEVRSGVGSVVVPLNETRKADEIDVACAMLAAAATCAPAGPVPAEILLELDSLGAAASILQEGEAELFFEARAKLLEVISRLIPDEILRDAFRASHWRLIRWRMRALGAGEAAKEVLRLAQMLCAARNASAGCSSGELLRLIAAAEA